MYKEDDLIAFSLWVNDKGYRQRLTVIPQDLLIYYKENRESIREKYLKSKL